MARIDPESRKRRQQRRAKKPPQDRNKEQPAARKPQGKTEVFGKRLTKTEARSLTDKVKADAAALWTKLKELHEGAAHEALGYDSWGSYVEAEFGFTRQHGYRLVKAGELLDLVGSNPGVTERHLRELTPLAQTPKELQAFWKEQVAAGEKPPPVAQLREAVRARLRESTRRPAQKTLNGELRAEAQRAARRGKSVALLPTPLRDRVRELSDGGDVPATIARKLHEEIPAVRLTATDVQALTFPPEIVTCFPSGVRSGLVSWSGTGLMPSRMTESTQVRGSSRPKSTPSRCHEPSRWSAPRINQPPRAFANPHAVFRTSRRSG